MSIDTKIEGGKVKILVKKDPRCIFILAANLFCTNMTFNLNGG